VKRGVSILAVMVLAPASCLAGFIGFNFAANRNDNQAAPIEAGEYDALAPSDVAGAPGFEQPHWNNLLSDWNGVTGAVPSPLVDDAGAPIPGLSVAYDAPNTWDTGIAIVSPHDRLMRNYLDSIPSTLEQPYLVIQNIPYRNYTVVVYVDGDTTDGRTAEYWIDDAAGSPTALTPHLWRTDRSNFAGSYTRISSGATSEARAEDGNFLVFSGLTSATLRVRANGPVRSPLNGIQVISSDEVTSWISADLALTPSVGATNRLDIGIHAQGTVQVDLGFPLGVRDIPINAADSDATTLSGHLILDLPMTFDPVTQQANLQGIEFAGGRVMADQNPSWTLDLGLYLGFIDLGDILLSGQNLAGYLNTPLPPGSLAGGSFPAAEHNFILNEGTITGNATGLAANFVDPINIDLATTPLDAQAGNSQGTLFVSGPAINGLQATYTVEVTAPVNFSDVVMETPVVTSATASGILHAEGTFTRVLPDFDGDLIHDGADPDDDNDLLPDTYEILNGLDPWNAADAGLDPDGDQQTTLQEYIAGTEPANGLSFFHISGTVSEPAPALSFMTMTGRLYRVEALDAFSDWRVLPGELSGTGGEAVFTDDGALEGRLYRITVEME
jgi:hypothetical protein